MFENILVAKNTKDSLKIIEDILEYENFSVTTLTGRVALLEKLHNMDSMPDLILIDIRLLPSIEMSDEANISGFEILKIARKFNTNIPIIYLIDKFDQIIKTPDWQSNNYILVNEEISSEDFIAKVKLNLQRHPQHEKKDGKYFQLQALRRAWIKVSLHSTKANAYYDENAFSRYEQYLEPNLIILQQLLETRSAILYPLICLESPKIGEDSHSKRRLYQAQPETSIILQALCDAISPRVEGIFIEQTYGNRVRIENREDTTEIFEDYWQQYTKFKTDVQHFATNHSSFFYHRVDIKQYYPRIDLLKLLRIIDPFNFPQDIWNLLFQFLFLDSILETGEVIPANGRGLPAGIPLSHLLGNLYLHEIDLKMKNHTSLEDGSYGYFRYVDDVIFFGPTARSVEEYRDIFERLLRKIIILPPEEESPLNLKKSTGLPMQASNSSELRLALENISGTLQSSSYVNLSNLERYEIAYTIHELLFEGSENPRITEELGRYTPLGIRHLISLDYDHAEIIHLMNKLLEKVSLSSNNIKYLVSILVYYSIENFQHEAIEFLNNPNPSIQLAFIQEVRKYPPEKINDYFWKHILDHLENKFNVILSREAALTISRAPQEVLSRLEIKTLHNNSHNLVRAYILILISETYPLALLKELISQDLTLNDPVLIQVIMYILDQRSELLGELELPEFLITSDAIARSIHILMKLAVLKGAENGIY